MVLRQSSCCCGGGGRGREGRGPAGAGLKKVRSLSRDRSGLCRRRRTCQYGPMRAYTEATSSSLVLCILILAHTRTCRNCRCVCAVFVSKARSHGAVDTKGNGDVRLGQTRWAAPSKALRCVAGRSARRRKIGESSEARVSTCGGFVLRKRGRVVALLTVLWSLLVCR